MPKKKDSSKVVPISKGKELKGEEALYQAQQLIYEAWESSGKKRIDLAKQALALSKDCAEAYVLLSEEVDDIEGKIKLLREAVESGARALGSDWEKKYKGVCWGAIETRPMMRSMARLALALQSDEKLDEALEIYRKLLKLNPNDNQGIRYLFLNALFEANLSDEFEKLIKEHGDDPSAALQYTKALHFFRKKDQNKAKNALKEAFKANPYVPIFLSDEVEMPDESPSSIGFGDEREAIAYVLDHGYLWLETNGSLIFMADTLESEIRKLSDDKEMIEAVLQALRLPLNDIN